MIRAFSLFSLLANIAEDVHQIRRRRYYRLQGAAAGRDAGALLANLQARGVSAKDAQGDVARHGRPGADRASDAGTAQNDIGFDVIGASFVLARFGAVG